MWELDHKEKWVLKNWYFWTMVLEKTLRVPWTERRSNQSILKEINPEYLLKGLMLKLEAPILWPPNVKNWLTGEYPDAGKDWRQTEKGMTEDEVVGCHHWLHGSMFEQVPELFMDSKAWHAAVQGVTKNQTWLSHWTEVTLTYNRSTKAS